MVGVVPLAITSRVAPFPCGSPTRMFGDAGSFASTTIERRDGSSPGNGSFTTNDLPRMV
jgi:hypothetical protein